jgi:hypothetical protein
MRSSSTVGSLTDETVQRTEALRIPACGVERAPLARQQPRRARPGLTAVAQLNVGVACDNRISSCGRMSGRFLGGAPASAVRGH